MDKSNKQNTATEHESAPMVPDLDYLMAMAFRESNTPTTANMEELS